jgi:hypothetical protein
MKLAVVELGYVDMTVAACSRMATKSLASERNEGQHLDSCVMAIVRGSA